MTRFRSIAPRIVMWVAASSALGGCQTINQMTGRSCDDPSLSASSRQICTDNQAFNGTISGGAIIGTIGGALTGVATCLVAAKKTNPLVCAGVGAAAGLFVGGVGGYLVAKKQEAATQKRRAINAITDDVRAQNQQMQTDINSAQQVVNEGKRKLAEVQRKTQSGEMSPEQASAERDKVREDTNNLTELVNHLQKQEKDFEEAGKQTNDSSAAYNTQIATMKRQIERLTLQRDTLNVTLSSNTS